MIQSGTSFAPLFEGSVMEETAVDTMGYSGHIENKPMVGTCTHQPTDAGVTTVVISDSGARHVPSNQMLADGMERTSRHNDSGDLDWIHLHGTPTTSPATRPRMLRAAAVIQSPFTSV